MNTLNYPIQTPEAKRFWASDHKCNEAKAIIAFSLTLNNANDNLRRYGYRLGWRHRAINAFAQYVNQPGMEAVPFSELSERYWNCMPLTAPGGDNYIITEDGVAIITEDGINLIIED